MFIGQKAILMHWTVGNDQRDREMRVKGITESGWNAAEVTLEFLDPTIAATEGDVVISGDSRLLMLLPIKV